MTFYVGDAVLEAEAGSFVFAPSGIPQNFTLDVEQPAMSDKPPAGLAAPMFLAPVAARYGIEVVGPPHRAQD